jgi:hypothetical protein
MLASSSSEKRAFMLRAMAVGAAYVAVIFAVAFAFGYNVIPGPLKIPAALLPIVPAAYFPFILLGKLRAMDELQRKIQYEAMVFAFAMTALLTLAFGFLQFFASVPDVNWVWVWPLMGVMWMAGIVLGRRRYA